MCCRFRMATHCLGHRFGGPDLDLNERPANGSVTVIDFDTDKPFGEAVTIVSYGK